MGKPQREEQGGRSMVRAIYSEGSLWHLCGNGLQETVWELCTD